MKDQIAKRIAELEQSRQSLVTEIDQMVANLQRHEGAIIELRRLQAEIEKEEQAALPPAGGESGNTSEGSAEHSIHSTPKS